MNISGYYKKFDNLQARRPKLLVLTDKQLRIKEVCEASFYEFVKHAWKTLENREFIAGWHAEAMCKHLEAAYYLEIRKLLINLPPRTGKSNIMSVLFPAWCWLKNPGLRFLYTAYAQTLSVRDSVGCRRLITSEWYQSLWSNKFRLMSDVNNKLKFDNNQGGNRAASSVGGTNTGAGGDFVVCFPYEVIVRTNFGNLHIGEIVENDWPVSVTSYNHQSNKWEFKPIVKKMKSRAVELVTFQLENGKILRCTLDHPIWIIGKGYIKASEIRTDGDKCLIAGEIGWIYPAARELSIWDVYNLEVEGNNNYLANGVLVHNCDDPNNVKSVESEVIRTGINEWCDYVMSTRVSNFKTARWIVAQQRTHSLDLSGHILAKDIDDWIHLCLPMEYESNRKCVTIPINSKLWADPRSKEGELLWPQGIGPKELKNLKADFNHDSYRIAGQLQQRPAPSGGGIIQKDWFKWWEQPDYPEFQYVIQSWDTALTKSATSCYSACTTWGVFDQNGIKNVMLLSVFSEKIEYPELRKMAVRLYNNYEDTMIDEPITGVNRPDHILIEQKVSGYSLLQDLMAANIPVLKFNPNQYGDKIGRCRLVTHLMENGLVWLPTVIPNCQFLTEDAQIFLEAASLFPNDESNDIIDSMSQALIRLVSSGWVVNKEDPRDMPQEEVWKKQQKKLYY